MKFSFLRFRRGISEFHVGPAQNSNEHGSTKHGFWQRTEGGSLVEFALVLPMMMILITGMFSLGLGLNNYMILTNGVSAAARALSLTRGQTSPTLAATDPCAYAIQTAASTLPGINRSGITYTIAWTPVTGTGASYSTSCPGLAMNAGDSVSVKAVYSTPLLVFGWKPTSLGATAQTAELVQ